MTRVAARSKLTAAEYLAWEREQLDKHEFYAGEVFAMAGGSPRHNHLAASLQAALQRVLGDRCFTFTSDQRIAVDNGSRYVYPDASVTDLLVNPTILVEVLSSSTEQYDRGLKWEGYQRLAALTDYLLVSQHHVRIEHFQRSANGGWLYRAYGTGDRVALAGGAQLDVDAVFARAFELPADDVA